MPTREYEINFIATVPAKIKAHSKEQAIEIAEKMLRNPSQLDFKDVYLTAIQDIIAELDGEVIYES